MLYIKGSVNGIESLLFDSDNIPNLYENFNVAWAKVRIKRLYRYFEVNIVIQCCRLKQNV